MKLKNFLKIAYLTVFFGLLCVIGIFSFAGKNNSPKKEEKVELKVTSYMDAFKGFDKYVSANFGFRSRFIQLNNQLKYNIFNESGSDEVIAGDKGFLFYKSALHDYIGEDILSDAEIGEIAGYIKSLQAECEKLGAEFVFVVAPNKMSIYGEYMPYYYIKSEEKGNYEKLMIELEKKGVAFVDLKQVLLQNKEAGLIYHKLDSHWNNVGAGIAYEAIMDKAGLSHREYSTLEYETGKDFVGDLYEMLFPEGSKKDEQMYYGLEEYFSYTSRFTGVDDLYISTENTDRDIEGSVLMFRDSFGNSLHCFFAADFKEAEFSRALPYDITLAEGKNLVVIEIVERNIPNLLKYVIS